MKSPTRFLVDAVALWKVKERCPHTKLGGWTFGGFWRGARSEYCMIALREIEKMVGSRSRLVY